MIEKKYLFNNKDAENYCIVQIEAPKSATLSEIVESVANSLEESEIMDDIWPAAYNYIGEDRWEVLLDVDDVEFFEFED
jgi:hypothetical protein